MIIEYVIKAIMAWHTYVPLLEELVQLAKES